MPAVSVNHNSISIPNFMQKLIAIINISVLILDLIVGLITGDEKQGLVMA